LAKKEMTSNAIAASSMTPPKKEWKMSAEVPGA
jgi:hypothetical protein